MTKSGPGQLTPRQREVLRLAARGATHKEIANQLGVTSKTARNHLENLYQRLRVHSRAEATIHAVRLGLVEPHEANASSTSEEGTGTIDELHSQARRRSRDGQSSHADQLRHDARRNGSRSFEIESA